jgi:hypothetical protein
MGTIRDWFLWGIWSEEKRGRSEIWGGCERENQEFARILAVRMSAALPLNWKLGRV